MGWTFGWSSLASLVEDVERLGSNYEVVDRAARSGCRYLLVRDDTGELSIMQVLVKSARYNGRTEWGYKSIPESAGPCRKDCPARLLDKSTDMTPYAVQWREGCRSNARKEAARKHIIGGLKRGDVILVDGDAAVIEYSDIKGRRNGFVASFGGSRYFVANARIDVRPVGGAL